MKDFMRVYEEYTRRDDLFFEWELELDSKALTKNKQSLLKRSKEATSKEQTACSEVYLLHTYNFVYTLGFKSQSKNSTIMRMLSADEAAEYAVRAKDAADLTLDLVTDIAGAVCQLKDPSTFAPRPDTCGSIEVNFDGFQDTIVLSARDAAIESVIVIQREDFDDDESYDELMPLQRVNERDAADMERKHRQFRRALRHRRRDRDNF